MKLARNMKDPIIVGTTIAINYQLIKTLGFVRCKDFKIPIKTLLSTVEEHSTSYPLVSVYALNCIGSLITQSDDLYRDCKSTITSKTFFKQILKILNIQGELIDHVSVIEGSNYGFTSVGLFDGIFNFLSCLLEKISRVKEELKLFYLHMKEVQLDKSIIYILKSLSPKTQLSPKGFLIYLMFVCDCAYARKYGSTFHQELVNATNIKILVRLLSEQQFKSMTEWPQNIGGGTLGGELLVSQVIRILQLPFSGSVSFFHLTLI